MKNFKPLLVFIYIITSCLSVYSQKQTEKKIITIEAVVHDKDTKEPLPFTNVLIEGTSIGTITNEEGAFELNVSQKYSDKNVIFSFVGYKNTTVALQKFKKAGKVVYLATASTSLEEIVVKAKNKYKEFIDDAIVMSTSNYAQIPIYLETYYRELTKIDNNYTKFADAACSIRYSAYNNGYDFQQSKASYMQFKRLEYEIKKVPFPEPLDLMADTKDQVKIVALRKSDNLQDYKIMEQSKDLKAIDSTDLKWVENNEIGGGPLRLTGADKIKRKTDFFDPKLNNRYLYTYYGRSTYNNRPVYIISFAPKDSTDSKARYRGKITLDEKSKAIISYQYRPTLLAKRKLNQKFGTQLKTPESVEKETKLSFITRTTSLLDYNVTVSYFEFSGKWYLKRIKIYNTYLNSGDLFDDFKCNTESELIVNTIHTNEDESITNTNLFSSTFSNAMFNYQLDYNLDFWKTYSTLVATGVIGKALNDLEAESSLEEQFRSKN